MASTRRTDFVKRTAPPAPNQFELFDRQPPFDLTAESGVLGSMMLMPDVIDDVVLELRADDFYDDANRRVFDHMLALHDAGSKVDPVLLTDRLKTAGDLELIGGPAYLA
ncbi:MAG: DnaB-like helicase N-terminal domain-containing protein, partial [Planctomycetota bacterium]